MVGEHRHAVTLASPPAEVWKRLQDPNTWQALGPVSDISEARHDAGGVLLGYRFTAAAGLRNIEGEAATVIADPPRILELALAAQGVDGRLRAEIEERGTGSHLTVSLTLRPSGWLADAFFPLIDRAIGSGLPQQVETFAAGFE